MAEEVLDSMTTEQMVEMAKGLHYTNVRVVPHRGVCGIFPFMFTGGLVYDIRAIAYEGRYCYGSIEEAAEALEAWDGEGDPPGAWIKLKGAGEDRVGPGLTA